MDDCDSQAAGNTEPPQPAKTKDVSPKKPCRVRRSLRILLIGLLLLWAGLSIWQWTQRTQTGPDQGSGQHVCPAGPGVSSTGNSSTIRVATFNIHSGRGSEGRVDLDGTAGVLRGYDLIGMNEVRA